ncbi:hypothetical protein B0H34DRAFT_195900 [Crassisporium funariophilum]|nr:hypothetical protein B0H34DRAFT_195900 [Crassisporium funariophilum]
MNICETLEISQCCGGKNGKRRQIHKSRPSFPRVVLPTPKSGSPHHQGENNKTQARRLGKVGISAQCSSTTVETLITHTPPWTGQGMGFQGLWVR